MRFLSTRGQADPLGFSEAVAVGLAPDGGLFLPETLPDLSGELARWDCNALQVHQMSWRCRTRTCEGHRRSSKAEPALRGLERIEPNHRPRQVPQRNCSAKCAGSPRRRRDSNWPGSAVPNPRRKGSFPLRRSGKQGYLDEVEVYVDGRPEGRGPTGTCILYTVCARQRLRRRPARRAVARGSSQARAPHLGGLADPLPRSGLGGADGLRRRTGCHSRPGGGPAGGWQRLFLWPWRVWIMRCTQRRRRRSYRKRGALSFAVQSDDPKGSPSTRSSVDLHGEPCDYRFLDVNPVFEQTDRVESRRGDRQDRT